LLSAVFLAVFLLAGCGANKATPSANQEVHNYTVEGQQNADVTETEVINYAPSKTSTMKIQTGDCLSGSLTLPLRNDAWRCYEKNAIYDPCFTSPNGREVICPDDPEKNYGGMVLKTTNPLPQPDTSSIVPANYAWKIRLQDGTDCFSAGGATFTVGNDRANYSCSDDETVWLIGEPTVGKVWTAKKVVLKPGEGSQEERAATPETVFIQKVWQ
jgi:hypothetical protein